MGEASGIHCERFFGTNSTCRQRDFGGKLNSNPEDLGHGFVSFDNIVVGFITVRPIARTIVCFGN